MQSQEPDLHGASPQWLNLRRRHEKEQHELKQRAEQSRADLSLKFETARAHLLARQQREEEEFWKKGDTQNADNSTVKGERPPALDNQSQSRKRPMTPRTPAVSSSSSSRLPQPVKSTSTPTCPLQSRPTPESPIIDLSDDDNEPLIRNTKAPAPTAKKSIPRFRTAKPKPSRWPKTSNFLDLSNNDSNKSWTKKPSMQTKNTPGFGSQKADDESRSAPNPFVPSKTMNVKNGNTRQTDQKKQGMAFGGTITKAKGEMDLGREVAPPPMHDHNSTPRSRRVFQLQPHVQDANTSTQSARKPSSAIDTASHLQQPSPTYSHLSFPEPRTLNPGSVPDGTGVKKPLQQDDFHKARFPHHTSGLKAQTVQSSSSSNKRKLVNLSSSEEEDAGSDFSPIPDDESDRSVNKEAAAKKSSASSANNAPLLFKKMKPGSSDTMSRDAQQTFNRVAMAKAPLRHSRSVSRASQHAQGKAEGPFSPPHGGEYGFANGSTYKAAVERDAMSPACSRQRRAKQHAEESIQALCTAEEQIRTEQAIFDAERQEARLKKQATGENTSNSTSKHHSRILASTERDISNSLRGVSLTPGPSTHSTCSKPQPSSSSSFTTWIQAHATGDRHISKYRPPQVTSDNSDDEASTNYDIKSDKQWQVRRHRSDKTPVRSAKRK